MLPRLREKKEMTILVKDVKERFLIRNALLPRATIGTKNASIVSNVAPP